MAFRRIPVRIARSFFIKRRFTFGVAFASVPFLGYLLIFGRSISAPGKIFSTDVVCNCPCSTKQQTQNSTLEPKAEAIVTSIAGQRNGSLNAHMWYGIWNMWNERGYFEKLASFSLLSRQAFFCFGISKNSSFEHDRQRRKDFWICPSAGKRHVQVCHHIR